MGRKHQPAALLHMPGEQVSKTVDRGLIQPGEGLVQQPKRLIRATGQRQRHAARLPLTERPDRFVDEAVHAKAFERAAVYWQPAVGVEAQVFARAEVGQQAVLVAEETGRFLRCLLYTSPSPRD